jgi:hypothetical protein
MSPTTEPSNLVERAAAAALQAVDAVLEEVGGRAERVYIAIQAGDLPAGELDAVSAAGGYELPEDVDERARDVFAFLISEAASTGKAIGVRVDVVPLATRGQG